MHSKTAGDSVRPGCFCLIFTRLFSKIENTRRLLQPVDVLKAKARDCMNSKEVGELRRRLAPDKNAITHIYGCFVNGSGEIVADIQESMGTITQQDAEEYLGLLKKTLSGSLGRNLIDIVFSTEQVMDSEEHRLLSALRGSALRDAEARTAFYQKIIGNVDMDGANYLILLAHDTYDVPRRGGDGETQADASDEVFSYILCCVCPVRDGKQGLGYFSQENEFHSYLSSQTVAPPELGFLFPAFDDRTANIYNALFYTRRPDNLHSGFIDAVFHTEPPLSATEQREGFETALADALEDACSADVVQAVHEQLCTRIQLHKESRDPEPLTVTAGEVGQVLADCGVEEPRVQAFCEKCDEQFGQGAALSPENLIDSKHFQLKTGDAVINVSPESSYLVQTRVIDGRKYILIPADEGVEINGLAVGITTPQP